MLETPLFRAGFEVGQKGLNFGCAVQVDVRYQPNRSAPVILAGQYFYKCVVVPVNPI